MMRRTGLAMILVAALTGACGNGDDATPQAVPTGTASAESYCGAVADLNERAEAIFADVDEDDEAAREAAEAELYEAAGEIGYLDAAPDEIREDVRTFFEGTYGPQDETYDEADVKEAEERVLDFEEEHCEEE